MRFLFLFILLLLCKISYGQFPVYSYGPYTGTYYYYPPFIMNEERIKSRWRIQDEYKERNKSENYLDYRTRMMDQAEKKYEIDRREQELIKQGILPPKNPNAGTFVYDGIRYPSWEDFKLTSAYVKYRQEIEEKRLLKKEAEFKKEYERQRDIAFLQLWHKLGDIGKERFNRSTDEEKEKVLDEIMFKNLGIE